MTAMSILIAMKKIFKKFSKKFNRVSKFFLVGFTFLTVLSFALNGVKPAWIVSSLLGYSFIAWQVVRNE